jgi:hypothetical protein
MRGGGWLADLKGGNARVNEKMKAHEKKVVRIARQLRERKSTLPLSLKKKSVSHLVPKPEDKRHTDEKLDISDFDEIIYIDKERCICIAEPGVTFEKIVNATIKHGLVPLVVPELKTITIGGAVAGCSIESMSYMFGGFHDNCLKYEIVTAKGDVLECTPENENRLLFQMVNGTFGTLGIITLLEFRLIAAKPFVKVIYEKYESLEDYMKTVDYFFRYNKGVTNVHPKSFVGRLMFGRLVNSDNTLKMANNLRKLLPPAIIPITVDTFIPFSKIEEFMEWYKEEIDHFPLWCVPYKIVHKYEWISDEFFSKVKDKLFLDIAIYGMRRKDSEYYYRIIEKKLLEIGAIKTLISTNLYSEEEFWSVWNKMNYDAVKIKTDPDNIFRGLYEKTCRASRGLGR